MKRFFLLIFSFLLISTNLWAGKDSKRQRSRKSLKALGSSFHFDNWRKASKQGLKFYLGGQRSRPDFKNVVQKKKFKEVLYDRISVKPGECKVDSLFPPLKSFSRLFRQAELVKRLEDMPIEGSRPILRLYAISKGVQFDEDHELKLPQVQSIRDLGEQAQLTQSLVQLFPEEVLPIINLFLGSHEDQKFGYPDRS